MESKDAVHNGGLFSDTPLCGNAILCLPWAVMAWVIHGGFSKMWLFPLGLITYFFLIVHPRGEKSLKIENAPK